MNRLTPARGNYPEEFATTLHVAGQRLGAYADSEANKSVSVLLSP